jgi:hypothetical protein
MEAIAVGTTPATPVATLKLFSGFWTNSQRKGTTTTTEAAITASLLAVAETLDRKLTPTTIKTYLAVLSDLTREQNIQAFSRAAAECRFFPSPAALREMSGSAAAGDPIANEARAELFRIVAAMRGKHGPKLRDIPGAVLYGTEEKPLNKEGKMHWAPIRAAGTPFCLSRRAEDALLRLGWGDRTTGIELIAEHPMVAGRAYSEDDQYQTNRLRAADELLAKWTTAYREVA